jgi:hypothetical protein
MRRFSLGLGAAALLVLISLAPSSEAQSTAITARPERPFNYDATKEATLTGKISEVITKPTQGMLWGSHLMIETSNGPVDASLGTLARQGRNSTLFAVGDQVEVTGVMKTFNGKQVFLTRTVKLGGEMHTFRNENGFPVREATHNRETQQAAQKEVRP